MKVLIIGGTGHIGSYLVPRLVRAGFTVQVVARNPEPHYSNPHLGWPARTTWPNRYGQQFMLAGNM